MSYCLLWAAYTWVVTLLLTFAGALQPGEVSMQVQCDRCKCGSSKYHSISDVTFLGGQKKRVLDMNNCWDCPTDFGECKTALQNPSLRRKSNLSGIGGAHSIYRYYTTAKDVDKFTDLDRKNFRMVKTGTLEDCELPRGVDSPNRGIYLGFVIKIFAVAVKKPLLHSFNFDDWYPPAMSRRNIADARGDAVLPYAESEHSWQPPLLMKPSIILLNFFEYDKSDDGGSRKQRWGVWDIAHLIRKPPQNVAQFYFLPYRRVRFDVTEGATSFAGARKFFEVALPQRKLVHLFCPKSIGGLGPCARGTFEKYLFEAEAICMEKQLHNTLRFVQRKLATTVKALAKQASTTESRSRALDLFYDYLNRFVLKKAQALNGGVVHTADAQINRDCIALLLAKEYNGLRDFAASLVPGHIPRLGLFHSQINKKIQATTGGAKLLPVAWDQKGLESALDQFYGSGNSIFDVGPARSPHDFIAGLS